MPAGRDSHGVPAGRQRFDDRDAPAGGGHCHRHREDEIADRSGAGDGARGGNADGRREARGGGGGGSGGSGGAGSHQEGQEGRRRRGRRRTGGEDREEEVIEKSGPSRKALWVNEWRVTRGEFRAGTRLGVVDAAAVNLPRFGPSDAADRWTWQSRAGVSMDAAQPGVSGGG